MGTMAPTWIYQGLACVNSMDAIFTVNKVHASFTFFPFYCPAFVPVAGHVIEKKP